MPISPSTSRSPSSASTGGRPRVDDLVEALGRHRRLEADVAGRSPTPTSIASTVAPAMAANALIVDVPARYAASIAAVTSVGYLLTTAAAATPWSAAKISPAGRLTAASRCALPAGDPRGDLVEPAPARRRAAGCRPPARDRGRRPPRRVAAVDERASSRSRRRLAAPSHGSSRRSARPATSSSVRSARGGPRSGSPRRARRGSARPSVGLGCTPMPDLVADDDVGPARRGGERRRRRRRRASIDVVGVRRAAAGCRPTASGSRR